MTKIEHGSPAVLLRGKKRFKVVVINDHYPFPALTIRLRSEEWVVKREEVLSQEQLAVEWQQKLDKQREAMDSIIKAFEAGNKTIRAIAEAVGRQMIDILSVCRKAEKLGFIKLERKA